MNWNQIEVDWNRITFATKYSKKPTNNLKYDELVLIQHFKDNKFVSKKNEDLIPDYFLYEMDDLSLDEQKKIYERLESENKLKYIKCLTFSGNKSIHCIVPICSEFKIECCNRTAYKCVWESVGRYLFGKSFEYLDMQCSSRGKYMRNPNGRRLLEGNKVVIQTCYFFNKKCVPLKSCQQKGIDKSKQIHEFYQPTEREIEFDKTQSKALQFLSKIKKETENIKLCKDVLLYNRFPKGANYVGAFWTLVNLKFSLDVLKRYCDLVSTYHPTNLSTSFWERNKDRIRRI